MKILHVLGGLKCGGIETFLINILRNTDLKKFEIDLLISDNDKGFYEDEVKRMGCNIYYLPPRNKGILLHKKNIDRFFNDHQYDVVHVHVSSLTDIDVLISAKKFGIKKRIIHGHSTSEFNNPLHYILHYFHKLYISKIATDFLSCSMDSSKWLYTKKIINSVQHHIIKNGIVSESFRFNSKIRKSIRKELALSEQKLVLGNVGRFVESKNQIFLIDICLELIKKDIDFVFLLLGSGKEKEYICKKIKLLNLEKYFLILEEQKDVCNYYNAMDIFVFPSLIEGLGIVLIEAQTAGLPVIIYNFLPKEVQFTDNVILMNRNSKAADWADNISKALLVLPNRNIRYNVYNIIESIKEIEKIYLLS